MQEVSCFIPRINDQIKEKVGTRSSVMLVTPEGECPKRNVGPLWQKSSHHRLQEKLFHVFIFSDVGY